MKLLIVKRKDEAQHGEYRTRRVILELYDAMQQAIDTGEPYQTRLDPSPGPPVHGLPARHPGSVRPADWPPIFTGHISGGKVNSKAATDNDASLTAWIDDR
jgi:hypothetical protein